MIRTLPLIALQDLFDSQLNPANENGETPLHLAAKNGHLEICKLILDGLGKTKNPVDKKGRTPLHHAARSILTITIYCKIKVSTSPVPKKLSQQRLGTVMSRGCSSSQSHDPHNFLVQVLSLVPFVKD